MKGYKSNPVVNSMAQIEITGNVIPMSWYQHLRRKNGKPHSIAIELLGDIVYWYKPIQVRDETTGQLIEYRKKFKADKLQRSYQAFADMYGYTKDQVRDALNFLQEKEVIELEFRHPIISGIQYGNILFIGLNTKKIIEFNTPLWDLNPIGIGKETDTYQEEIGEGIGFKDDTNTETSTEIIPETLPKDDPPAATLPLTDGLSFALTSFNRKRFANPIQKDTISSLEKTYGTSRLKEVITWAAKKGMGLGQAIPAIEKAIPTWGKVKEAPNGHPNGYKPSTPYERSKAALAKFEEQETNE